MLQRWSPFSELRRMEDTMSRLWRGFVTSEHTANGTEAGAWL